MVKENDWKRTISERKVLLSLCSAGVVFVSLPGMYFLHVFSELLRKRQKHDEKSSMSLHCKRW